MVWSLVGTNIFFMWNHYAFFCTHIFLSYSCRSLSGLSIFF